MDDFPKIAASAISLANRKLIHGIGINDAWFTVKPTINGKRVPYKPYLAWSHMLKRCYSDLFQMEKPTYVSCTVCEEWLIFSNFEKWMLTQNFDGLALDKDIIKQGNKIYAPEYCRFISQALNSLLTTHGAARGDLPLGVDWHNASKKYRAKISINGKQKILGYFKTAQEAKAAYDKAKYAEIRRHALMQTDPEIKAGLMNWEVE